MKKFIFMLVALTMCLAATAQPWKQSYPTFSQPNYYPSPLTQEGQMIRIDNAYAYVQFNTIPFVPSSFLDTTTTGTSTMFLYIAASGNLVNVFNSSNSSTNNPPYYGPILPIAAADTFVPFPIYNDATLSITVNITKVSGTPAGSVTVESSPDGFHWGPIHTSNNRVVSSVLTGTVTAANTLSSPDTMTINNVSGVQAYTFIVTNDVPYHRLRIATTGTETSTAQAWFFTNKHYFYTNN